MTAAPFTELPRCRFLLGDVRTQVRRLPTASVDCVITSPPYFGLRDYNNSEQLGAEADIQTWVRELVGVASELRRVLRPDGTLWLNVGDGYSRHPREGTLKKGLLLGPQRLACALADDGWLVRNQIVWAKRNPMPTSVADRLTCSHETVLLLSRSPRYYFDLDAIRVPVSTPDRPRRAVHRPPYLPTTAVPYRGRLPRIDLNQGLSTLKAGGVAHHPLGKNPGDVWWLSTAAYRGAHFAVFPAELVRRPLLAACPERRCTACGQPWRRANQRHDGRLLPVGPLQAGCACAATWRPGVVLDPFMGSGTVALVAEAEKRDWLGIELNPSFVALARARLATARGQPPAAETDGPTATT